MRQLNFFGAANVSSLCIFPQLKKNIYIHYIYKYKDYLLLGNKVVQPDTSHSRCASTFMVQVFRRRLDTYFQDFGTIYKVTIVIGRVVGTSNVMKRSVSHFSLTHNGLSTALSGQKRHMLPHICHSHYTFSLPTTKVICQSRHSFPVTLFEKIFSFILR